MSEIAIEKGPLGYDDVYEGRNRNGAKNTTSLVAHTYTHSAAQQKFTANPAPLGFFATAGTVFIFSMYNLRARGITVPNAGVGSALFFGGLCQFISGMWAFAANNTFGGNAFSAYGGFWLAYSPFLIPGFGITEAYSNHPGELPNATGMILAAWFVLTTIFFIGTLRVNIALATFFFLLDMNFLILMISDFTQSLTLQKVGGGIGLATAAASLYAGAANLLTEENCGFTLPVGPLNRSRE